MRAGRAWWPAKGRWPRAQVCAMAESGARPCAWNGAAMRDIACGLAPHVICWRRPPSGDDLRQIVATAEFYF
ncbi:hypothetical protein F511_45433 [Dorcoceras hygrometricum]|uniref:Uncharacterized protein n=1 Tax=Dorcoceras hygrometricum TaxID=472368 RepID=A0A2Z6ZW12_9LAMI|nr:hypothetical protein F511_45433 [Dorcoceras hygrometricum]